MKGVESTTVRFDCDEDGVLLLTLNRPERNNAWTGELGSALHTLLEQAAESETVRAIVITGAGRSFCPGLDTEDLDRVSQPGQSLDQTGNRPMSFPTLVPKPIVAAINGGCAGLGLVTALMSDVRFAAEDAKITTAFARRGLPAEEALSWMLPRIVGHATALDLLLSSRVVIGSEAAQIGLVHRAFPLAELLPAARAYARDLALNCSPIAMATAKRQVYRDWERSFVDSQQNARQLVGILRDTSPDFREGVRSFIERRPPSFAPLAEAVDPGADLSGSHDG